MFYLLDQFGVAVFAISGALLAGRKNMDMFGVVVIAIITAIGGGTLRDLILGHQPVFWVHDQTYIIVASVAALITFFTAHTFKIPTGVLLISDAVGLAVFTAIGVQIALDENTPILIAILMGVMTAVAGGVIRDVLCNRVPLILHKEIYATASLVGATSLALIEHLTNSRNIAITISVLLVLAIRLAAIRWHLSLPTFNLNTEK